MFFLTTMASRDVAGQVAKVYGGKDLHVFHDPDLTRELEKEIEKVLGEIRKVYESGADLRDPRLCETSDGLKASVLEVTKAANGDPQILVRVLHICLRLCARTKVHAFTAVFTKNATQTFLELQRQADDPTLSDAERTLRKDALQAFLDRGLEQAWEEEAVAKHEKLVEHDAKRLEKFQDLARESDLPGVPGKKKSLEQLQKEAPAAKMDIISELKARFARIQAQADAKEAEATRETREAREAQSRAKKAVEEARREEAEAQVAQADAALAKADADEIREELEDVQGIPRAPTLRSQDFR